MTEQEWHTCTDPETMLSVIGDIASERKLRLFAVACCRRVWNQLADKRSRRAIEIIEQHIEGQASAEQMQTANTEAKQAYRSTKERVLARFVGRELAKRALQTPRGLFNLTNQQMALEAHNAADDDPTALAASAVWGAASVESDFVHTGCSLLDSAINTANQLSDPAQDPLAEKAAQAEIIRDIFGNPFRDAAVDPSWPAYNDGGVLKLAKAIYDDRDFDGLPALADILEEAGCGSADILMHCRAQEGHVRGCWVIDLLLGRK